MRLSTLASVSSGSVAAGGSVVQEGSFDLIESMAEAIARECLTFDRVLRATVIVHKPNAASRLGIQGVAAAVTLPER